MEQTEREKREKANLVECIKVALPANVRHNAKEKLMDFGRKVFLNKMILNKADSKLSFLGRQGIMTLEDYNNGNFGPYGLDAADVKGYSEMDQLRKENARLQTLILEKESKIIEEEIADPKPEEKKAGRKKTNIEKLNEE